MQPLTGQIVTLKNVFTRNLETKITPSVNWLPLYGPFPTVGLPLQTLCTAVILYITVTWPFPKDDRYIQV